MTRLPGANCSPAWLELGLNVHSDTWLHVASRICTWGRTEYHPARLESGLRGLGAHVDPGAGQGQRQSTERAHPRATANTAGAQIALLRMGFTGDG